MCKAVRNEVTSWGEGGGGASENIACRGGAVEVARAREKVCLSDEKLFAFEGDVEVGGEGGR